MSERFWGQVAVAGDDDCWEWTSKSQVRGYGIFALGRRAEGKALAHRVAWLLAHGWMPPPEIGVYHDCDNPPCCNPRHFFIGPRVSNVRDMLEKGRLVNYTPHGEDCNFAKLTWPQVREIRSRRAKGESCVALGAIYGVDRKHISRIARGKCWIEPS